MSSYFVFKFYRRTQKLANSQEQEVNQYFVSDEQLEIPEKGMETLSLEEALSNCVKHHQMILEFAKLLEDYFRWFLFPKFFYSCKDNFLLDFTIPELINFLISSIPCLHYCLRSVNDGRILNHQNR